MIGSWRKGLFAAVAAASLALAPMQSAVAMTVQPVVVDIQTSGRGMSAVVTVQNTFATPLTVELRVEELDFDENGVKQTGRDSGDLLVFPPQAIIQPGETQSFRVQWVGDPALARSKHYYVTVAQLPVELPEGQSAIQILYNFQVLVSVAPQGQRPSISVVSTEIGRNDQNKPVPVLVVENTAAAHGYLANGRLRIIQRDGSGRQVFERTLSGPEIQQTIGWGLVGAGQKRRVTVPVELPAEGGTIEAQFVPEGRR